MNLNLKILLKILATRATRLVTSLYLDNTPFKKNVAVKCQILTDNLYLLTLPITRSQQGHIRY